MPSYHIQSGCFLHRNGCGGSNQGSLFDLPWDDTSYSYRLDTGLPCRRESAISPSLWLLDSARTEPAIPGLISEAPGTAIHAWHHRFGGAPITLARATSQVVMR